MKKIMICGISIVFILLIILSVFLYGMRGHDDKQLALDKVSVTMNYDGFANKEEYNEIISEFYVSQDISEKYKNAIKINLTVENNSDETVQLALNDLENEYFYVYESFIRLEPWMPIAANGQENTEMYILTTLSEENLEVLKNQQFSFTVYDRDTDDWENFVSKDIDCNVTVN